MSALLAMPCILREAVAVADSALPHAALPVWRARPNSGLAFYRKHTLALLTRYLHTSMELGRAPCILGRTVLRGRVTNCRLRTLEDLLIFVFDVEKCLKMLDRASQAVIAHIALEDYTPAETADILRESERTIHRIYGAAMDRLTRLFLETGLLALPEPGLSRGIEEIERNEPTKQTTYLAVTRKKVGSVKR
ncbi:MAG TPA: hypothetical protein VHX37_07555 [Acidobacteriaceae bacterium]|jgi:hypothetical protein|nr:hypothetical protein [Acidobacteriaceae bacterium]